MNEYIKLRRFIGADLVAAVWVIGALAITVYALLAIRVAGQVNEGGFLVVIAVLGFVVGNLVWRLICEAAAVLFRIHGLLQDADGRLESVLRHLRYGQAEKPDRNLNLSGEPR